MRVTLVNFLFIAVLVVAAENEQTIEDDDVDERVKESEEHIIQKREVNNEEPLEEHIRVKRRYDEETQPGRVRRSSDYVRVPRNVHQYEVHENTEDSSLPSSPPYEEMLAASAEHYHRVYASPGAPSPARYANPEVSAYQYTPGVRPVPSYSNPNVYVYTNPRSNPTPSPREFIPSNKDKYVNVIAHKPIVTFANPAPVLAHAKSLVSDSSKVGLSKLPEVELITAAPKEVYVSSVSVVPVVRPEAAVVGPAVVSSEPVPSPLKKLDGEDQSGAAGHIHKHHAHVVVHGGGQGGHAGHHGARGGKHVKGFKKNHHSDKGGKGFKKSEVHKKEYENAEGLKKKHRDHADHKGSHVEQAHGQKGSHFDEKKGHKKGHKTKGYHNKYHKDEFHKEHKFYDDYHKSGEHHRYGKFNAKHASNESGKKKAHHVNTGHDFVEHGKKGFSNKGHVDADHKGYKGKHGHEEHKEHHSHHGKKGGKEGGSEWGYSKKE